ncbi:hypothetical protein FDENT_13943 [Fusarium denticulatum]|uniref:Uncharacterized protein n=1 Tax=Fusarium denticulatum TaxID=48507 RepID=A0A8H5WIJ7_9HYPO|nr:hypothetical protein FDENT_13943 [Fusarium denticulatum]
MWAQSNDNDEDLMSLFDTFYDAPGSTSPEQEPAIIGLETLEADFESILTDIQSLANDIKPPMIDAEARAIDTDASSASFADNNTHRRQYKPRSEHERILANLAWNTSKNHICGTGNDTNTSSVNQAGPVAEYRHSSSNIDDVKCDRNPHILDVEKHHTNTLSQDIDISVQIHDTLLDEKQTGKVLIAAKVRVEAVWHIWEATMKRDVIVELDKKYDGIRATVTTRLAAKRCDAREWKIMAYEEDWQGIFDEDLDKAGLVVFLSLFVDEEITIDSKTRFELDDMLSRKAKTPGWT